MTTSVDRYRLRERPVMSGRRLSDAAAERFRPFIERAEAVGAEPFTGITADGASRRSLFPLQRTGSSTAPIKDAADTFLASLTDGQRSSACFSIDSREWMRWLNVHPYVMRHGVLLEDLSAEQRQAALSLVEVSLSIEFDHESGVAFDHPEPTRTHIHTVVRTPNGNDYGRDLLRQHYEQFHHTTPP